MISAEDPCETGRWRTVDNVMVEGDRQVEHFPDRNLTVMHARFRCDAADGETQGVDGQKADPPAAAFAKHADRGDNRRPFQLFYPMGVPLERPKEEQPGKTRGALA